MNCDQQAILLAEEERAWSAYQELRDSGCTDKGEITRRADYASMASSRLREHMNQCPICQARSTGMMNAAVSGTVSPRLTYSGVDREEVAFP
jgi:hypothetical protein